MKLTREVKTGFLVILAIGLFIYGFNLLKGRNIFSSDTTFYAVYDNIQGLVPNSPVTLNGMKVGQVRATEYLQDNSGKIRVEIAISNSDVKVPKGSTARIVNELLVGTSIIIEFSANKEIAGDGDMLIGAVEESLTENVQRQLQPLQKKINNMVASIDSVINIVQAILNEDARKNLSASFVSIKNALATFEMTSKRIDTLIDGKLSNILGKVELITTNLANNNQQITNILNNFSMITDSIAKSNIKTAINHANKALGDFASTMEKINKGEGSVGMLVNDKKLYSNLDSATISLDRLLKDLKEHPKRYVHFSIFGKKEK